MRQALLLLTMVLCAGCTREKAGSASASAYTSDNGSELEAPRLIPAIQNQLNLMASGVQPSDPENLTAYKNLAGDVVNSMAADLHRAGLADSGDFRALKDSVMHDLGEGAEGGSTLDHLTLNQHIARTRRLISMYQQAMRSAGDHQ
ncbi:MAG: hypothetical protein QOK27_2592 [Gemmatimonadales bacterium]|nr:hypothetical protein [Gemmatimonadales bacterium]